jgi:lipoprotein-releasing system ATP-binding protein
MPPLIQVKNLHKTYATAAEPLEVLRGVDIKIEIGETLAIVGASGAGKSTLLHIMGTLDKPSAGEVLFEGRNLFEQSEDQLSEFRNKTMGFVFQFHHLLPMLTTQENTMLPCMIAGSSHQEAAVKAKELLSQVGLQERLEHRPSELSGGEQQRVAIARALVMEPRVLFADEPTGNLDSHTGDEIADLMMELHERHGMTLVVVTHNERLAKRLPRSVHLSDGCVTDRQGS